MKRKETRNEKILNHILNVFPDDRKIVLLDVKDFETGEYLEENIPMSKKDYKKTKEVRKMSVEPFVRVPSNKKLEDKYYKNFTMTEKGYLFEILRTIDAFGRLKYGENFQQYCRDFEDLAKVLNVSYNTIKQSLVPKMKKYDVLRIVTIEKGHEYADESFLSFNPTLAINGVEWDRWTVIVWEDVIREFKMLTDSQIKKVLGGRK